MPRPTTRTVPERVGHLVWGVVDVLAPPVCSICARRIDAADQTICTSCRRSFREVGRTVCPFCGAPRGMGIVKRRCPRCPRSPVHFDSARAAFRYGNRMADAIQALKYEGRHELGLALARAAFMAFVRLEDPERRGGGQDPTGLGRKIDVLVPVPMHFTRRWRRGYNQAEELALEFGRLAGLPCDAGLLVRRRRTPRQALLPPDRRARNVQGAFEAQDPARLTGARAGVFDDILTSGSTVNECARALKAGGAAEVHVVALSRA